MQGKLAVIMPGDSIASTTIVYTDGAPTLDELQGAVGGSIELVPHFDTILHEGQRIGCVVFCNEEGKLADSPRVNPQATGLWRSAVRHRGLPPIDDVLVGPIVILTGDDEFFAAL
jgi:hypothetical protein